jgi:hypothetical protein
MKCRWDEETSECSEIECSDLLSSFLCYEYGSKGGDVKCFWVEFNHSGSCVSIGLSCEVIFVREVCVGIAECEWDKESKCIRITQPSERSNFQFFPFIIIIIGLFV